MATQWIRRAKTCLRPDGAVAGVTLAVMRGHLSSGAAVPVSMTEYEQLEHVAAQWGLWEVSELMHWAGRAAAFWIYEDVGQGSLRKGNIGHGVAFGIGGGEEGRSEVESRIEMMPTPAACGCPRKCSCRVFNDSGCV